MLWHTVFLYSGPLGLVTNAQAKDPYPLEE